MSNKINKGTEVAEERTTVITKKDLTWAWFKWIFCYYHAASYVRYYGLAFCNSISHILRKLYKKDEEFCQALSRETSLYITCAGFGAVINGIVIAMEEEKSKGADIPDESFGNIKAALMGPMAGFGDTIADTTVRTLCIAIFQPMAAAGMMIAPILANVIAYACRPIASFLLIPLGYKMGREAAIDLLESGTFKKILSCASVLSMFIMGSMSFSYVNLTTTLSFAEGTVVLNDILESCLPGILKIGPVLACYGLLRKNVKMIYIILGIVAISIFGAFVGIW